MAVAYVANTGIVSSSSGASSTISTSISCGAGSNRLLLAQTRTNNNSISAASYNGAAMTNAGTFGGLKMWRKTAPTTGSNTLSFTTSANYTLCSWSASSWSGVDQATPLGSASTASGTSANPATPSITCPSGGAIFASEWSNYAAASIVPTISSGTLLSVSRSLGYTAAGGYRTTTGTIGWTITSAAWEVQGFPINAAVADPNPRYGDMNFMGI